ncbi:MAG: hypothetical protein JWM33_2947 [Caulobacteraceae bacterium]|nr:hypothetical protein [Caulobacteraceae bacterium]
MAAFVITNVRKSRTSEMIGRRMGFLGRRNAFRLLGASSLAALALGILPARAAAPAGTLETLARDVVGVIGSGDQLSLRIKPADGPARTLKVGDLYQEGWVLKALSPTMATMTKDGQLHLVGLNPTGELAGASADAPGSLVLVQGAGGLTGQQVLAIQGEIAAGRWNGQPAWGMDQARTARLIAYDVQRDSILAAWYAQNWQVGKMAMSIPNRPTEPEIFGVNNEDYQALNQARVAYRNANVQAEMTQPLTGPSEVTVLAGQIPIQVLTAAGGDPRGTWALSPSNADGSRTLSRGAGASGFVGVLDSAVPIANRGAPQ